MRSETDVRSRTTNSFGSHSVSGVQTRLLVSVGAASSNEMRKSHGERTGSHARFVVGVSGATSNETRGTHVAACRHIASVVAVGAALRYTPSSVSHTRTASHSRLLVGVSGAVSYVPVPFACNAHTAAVAQSRLLVGVGARVSYSTPATHVRYRLHTMSEVDVPSCARYAVDGQAGVRFPHAASEVGVAGVAIWNPSSAQGP